MTRDRHQFTWQIFSQLAVEQRCEWFTTTCGLTKMTDFDGILKSVGEFGFFQKKVFFFVQLASFPLFFQNLVLVFVAAQPKWSCLGALSSPCTQNGTICPKALFSADFTSIATEWSLVCGEAYKNELVQSLFMAGNMIGSPLIGGLADHHGRRKMWMISIVLCSFLAFVSAFAMSYNQFLIVRFFTGIFAGGGGLVTFVLSTESVGPSYRGECECVLHTLRNHFPTKLCYYILQAHILVLLHGFIIWAGGGGQSPPPNFFENYKVLLRKMCFQPSPHFESLGC